MGSMLKKVRFAAVGVLAMGIVLPAWAADPGSPLSLSVRAAVEYDDNRDAVESGREDTFNYILQPRVGITHDLAATYLDLYYMPYLLIRSDARDDQDDTELYHELGIDVRHELSPIITLRANNRFSRTDDPRATEGGITVRERASFYMNMFTLGLDAELMPMTLLSVDGSSEIKRYDRSIWKNYEEDRHGGSLRFRREMGMMMNVVKTLRYTRSKFYGDFDRGAEFFFVGLGMEKTFSPNLAGYLHVGWNRVEHNEISGSKNEPAGSARLIVSPSPDTSLSLAARYELADSDALTYSTQERTSFAVLLDHRFTPQLSSAVRVEHALGKYRGETSIDTTARDGNDDMTAVHLRGVYSILRNLDLEVGYLFEDWDSDVREEFTRNKYTVAVRASL